MGCISTAMTGAKAERNCSHLQGRTTSYVAVNRKGRGHTAKKERGATGWMDGWMDHEGGGGTQKMSEFFIPRERP